MKARPALTEFRNWYKQYPKTPTIECLKWVIESVGEMNFKEYNQELLERDRKKEVIENEDYDDQQYLCTLDNSVIATGFAQLVDEGLIEVANKPIIQLAISRQIIGAELSPDWEHADQYIDSLKVLDRVLKLV